MASTCYGLHGNVDNIYAVLPGQTIAVEETSAKFFHLIFLFFPLSVSCVCAMHFEPDNGSEKNKNKNNSASGEIE